MRGAERLILLGALALAACGGGKSAAPCARRADHGVVGCFDGQPVTAAEVREHVRPAEPVRGRAVAPPASEEAWRRAMRVRMFAAEAVKRKLAPGDGRDARSRAVLYQAFVRDENERVGTTWTTISLADARARYEARPGDFNKVTQVRVSGMFVDGDARDAEARFLTVAGLSAADFMRAGGQDLGEAHADGIDPAIRWAANDLRAAGDVGGPVALADGRWVILRADDVTMAPRPFEEVATDVQHRIASEREAIWMEALDSVLSAEHQLAPFTDELARVAP